MANPKMHNASPYFSLCGVVINEEFRNKIEKEFHTLKIKHFKKDVVIHYSELRKLLNKNEKVIAFSEDLEKLLNKFPFFLLYVIVDNKKANAYSWNSKASYRKVYREIVGNLIKFLLAKNAMGKIFSEASNSLQDISLYESFFHYIANGIPQVSISPLDVKKHLTAVSFVTKANNDTEEQIADLFAAMGRIKIEVDKGIKKEEDLDSIEKVLFKIARKNLFVGRSAKKASKVLLYNSINSFLIIP